MKWIDDITGYHVKANAVTFTISNSSYLTTPYVTGNAHSSVNLSYNNGITSSATSFNQDIYVARYDFNTGLCQWARTAGGPYDDVANGIVASKTSLNSVYITGSYRNQFNFGTTQLNSTGGTPMFDDHLFLARTDENGTLDWADDITGECDGEYSVGSNVAIEPAGSDKVWVTGNVLTNMHFNYNHPGSEVNLLSSGLGDNSFFACHYNDYCDQNRLTAFNVFRPSPSQANINLVYNPSLFPPGMPIPVEIYYRPKMANFPNNECYDPSPWSSALFTGSLPFSNFTISGLMPVVYEWGYRIVNPVCTPEGNTMAISGMTLDNTFNARSADMATETSVSVYPNPLSDKLVIEYNPSNLVQDIRIKISDLAGRLLINDAWQPGTLKQEYNTQPWPSGIYLYQVVEDGHVLQSGKLSK